MFAIESTGVRNQRRESESDSDGSQVEGGGRSLDLASSHSSDEDDVTSRSHRNMGMTTQQHVSYLPNIHTNPAEHLISSLKYQDLVVVLLIGNYFS